MSIKGHDVSHFKTTGCVTAITCSCEVTIKMVMINFKVEVDFGFLSVAEWSRKGRLQLRSEWVLSTHCSVISVITDENEYKTNETKTNII